MKNSFKSLKKMIFSAYSMFLSSRGFTLVELLAVGVVTVVIGTIITIILTSTLRGNNKTNTLNQVRQNGNYALFQVAKMIQYASNFNGVSVNGVDYNYNCVSEVADPIPTPIQYKYLKITNFDEGQTIFSCSVIGTDENDDFYTVASNGASLVDINSVIMSSCYFSCIQTRITNVPTIGINFSLEKKNSGTENLEETQSVINFETSVTMRNFGRNLKLLSQ